MSEDLIPLDGYQRYEAEYSGSYEKMKEIRLCVELQKAARGAGIPVGNFFTFDTNVGQGEDPIMTDIGPSFEAVVLRDAQFLSAWNDEEKRTEMSSSEYRANGDPIILYDGSATQNDVIAACLPYTNKLDPVMSIKYLKDSKFTNLRTKYVAYILYEGEVYKFNFAATDNTGCEPKAFKPLGFGEAAEDSFHGVKHRCYAEAGANLMFSHVIEFSSKKAFEKSVDIIKSFKIVGRVTADRKEELDNAIDSLYTSLRTKFQKKTIRAWQETPNKEDIICFDERHIPWLVANPSIFTQEERLTALAPDVQVPAIAERAGASTESTDDSRADVIDVEPVEAPEQPKKKAVRPDTSVKPRTKKEAIEQKRQEREYIEESGVGENAAQAAMAARNEAIEKRNSDPGLQDFLDATSDDGDEPESDSPEDDMPEAGESEDLPAGW